VCNVDTATVRAPPELVRDDTALDGTVDDVGDSWPELVQHAFGCPVHEVVRVATALVDESTGPTDRELAVEAPLLREVRQRPLVLLA
jgi:hypothetical protein